MPAHLRAAVPPGIQIGTTLRYLMYHDSYGEPERAREMFAKLPLETQQIDAVDYSRAAELCPNGIDCQHTCKCGCRGFERRCEGYRLNVIIKDTP